MGFGTRWLEAELQRRAIEKLFQSTRRNASVTLLCAALAGALAARYIEPWQLAAWVLGFAIYGLGRSRLRGQYRRSTDHADPALRRRFVLGSILSGSLWGLLLAAQIPMPLESQFVTLTIALSLVLGASMTQSVVPASPRAFIAAITLLPVVAWTLSGRPANLGLAAALLLYGGANWVLVTRLHARFVRSHQLRITDERLTRELKPEAPARSHSAPELTCAEQGEFVLHRQEAIARATTGIAHDFGNLVGVASVCLEQIASDTTSATTRRRAEVARNALRRAVTLTRGLLDFSRREDDAPEPVNVTRCLEDLAGTLLQSAVGPHIELQVHLAPEPIHAHVVRVQLETAVLNLVLNARDAMPSGGTLSISTRVKHGGAASAERDSLQISIEDSGEGVPPEMLDSLATPYATSKPRGAGLGLFMTRCFAEASQGSFAIESRPGHTHAKLCLPVCATPERGQPLANAPARGVAPVGHPLGMFVIVATSRSERGHAIARRLRGSGYQPMVAANAALAAHVLRELTSDAALPDGVLGMIVELDDPDTRSLIAQAKARPDVAIVWVGSDEFQMDRNAEAPHTAPGPDTGPDVGPNGERASCLAVEVVPAHVAPHQVLAALERHPRLRAPHDRDPRRASVTDADPSRSAPRGRNHADTAPAVRAASTPSS